jgi:hypothetical protein
MRLKSEPNYLEKRTKVPLGISMYSMVYLAVKRTAFLDTFAVILGIIFKIELRLIVALILMVILKKIYCSLLIQTMHKFQQREKIFEWLKGYKKETIPKERPKHKNYIPFSKN